MSTSARAATSNSDLARAHQRLDELGYCVIPNVLSPAFAAALKSRLIEQAEGERARGVAFRDGGPGRPNQRVWMLLNKGQVFRDLVVHPMIEGLMTHLLGPDYLLSSLTANIAHPGGEPMAMHTDQNYVGFWTPRPVVANIAWMLDDFTDENGGTRLVPASHGAPQIAADAPNEIIDIPAHSDTIAPEGAAGSLLCFDGRIWHATGANRTTRPRHAILSYHCRPFMRQQENYVFGLDPALRATERPALLDRLGFRPWEGLGRVESPKSTAALYIPEAPVGPLASDGTPIHA